MSLSKKDFIALADAIKWHNKACGYVAGGGSEYKFQPSQLSALADFCKQQNGNFLKDRWLDYIAGKCGPNGGKVKP